MNVFACLIVIKRLCFGGISSVAPFLWQGKCDEDAGITRF